MPPFQTEAATAAPAQSPAASGRSFFGHPRGLATLFMTEMWERFSFYGMRALLVLYLVAPAAKGGLGFAAATAAAVYSIYNAMVYLLTLPGGWVSDRFWGPRRTVGIAGVVIMAGHFLLAVPAEASFFAGLVLIALGSGLLKANISTMVGHLYPERNDPRRDGGFTVFYMGINIGAFAAPLVIGTVGQRVNWHLGFALAGVGMALGLAQYVIGGRHLSPESSRTTAPLSREQRNAFLRKSLVWVAVAAVFYGALAAGGRLDSTWIIWSLTAAGLLVPVASFARIRRDRSLSADERSKVSGYIWLFTAAALFWMIYDQSGSTLNLFANDHTADSLWGFHFPSTWFQSLNPLMIMALGPVIAWLWQWLAARRRNPGTPVKFALGLLGIGLSFGVMMLAMAAAAGGRVSPLWLSTVYLVQTVAELCLSPVGLSVTTRLAPKKYAAQMMGLWFLAVTAGDCVAAVLQQSLGGAFLSTASFALQGAAVALGGVAVWMYRRRISGTMGDVH